MKSVSVLGQEIVDGKLNLTQTMCYSKADGVDSVANQLIGLPDLHDLNLRFNWLQEKAVKMSEVLAKLPALRILNLSHNDLSIISPVVAENLAKSASLRDVQMGDNNLTNKEAIEIAMHFVPANIKLGIDQQFHQPILAAIEQSNNEMHVAFEEAMIDTFGKPTPGGKALDCKELLGLMEDYADSSIELAGTDILAPSF